MPDCVRAFAAGQQVRIRNPAATRPWQHVLDPLCGYLLLGESLLRDDRDAQAWNFGPGLDDVQPVTEGVSGPGWQCPGATDDELDGVLGRWAALESWAQAGKLGVIREKVRRAELPGPRGTVSSAALESAGHEIALALAMSVQGADKAAWLAVELARRLPGIGALLAGGTLTQSKAAMLAQELSVLSDADAAAAEALILGQLAGKTHGQLIKLAAQAACTVDPEGAEKRRKAAERDEARVRLWREQSGTAALKGSGLPSDEALSAFASLGARAQDYQDSGAFPDARMDQLRALAYLDLLNGLASYDRIARAVELARAETEARAAQDTDTDTGPGSARDPGAGAEGTSGPGSEGPGSDDLGSDVPGTDDPDTGDSGDTGPGPDDPSPSGSGPGAEPGTGRRPALPDLIIPLRTLLGLARQPGEGHGLGPLDPGLALNLAAAASLSARSEWCITIVDADGIAIGHGCARPGRHSPPASSATPSAASAAFPARVNLTIPVSVLRGLSALPNGPSSPSSPPMRGSPWGFTSRDGSGPPGRYGTWTLRLPGGREFTVRLEPVPVFDCDHRNESRAYQPNDTLRHLVQVRDGECTFPSCSRHARESDFEHAVPYDKGGRTCACNAGARSRKCHRVKQLPGWNLTQPRPGWHQWTTPSGRVYTQGPKQYPA